MLRHVVSDHPTHGYQVGNAVVQVISSRPKKIGWRRLGTGGAVTSAPTRRCRCRLPPTGWASLARGRPQSLRHWWFRCGSALLVGRARRSLQLWSKLARRDQSGSLAATRHCRRCRAGFVPLRPGHVSIYLCGATVQGLPHIGHVRAGSPSTSCADGCFRAWHRRRVYHRNVTDSGQDRPRPPRREAGRGGKWAYPRACLHRGLRRSGRLAAVRGVARHRAYPRMIEMIERLIQAGHVYRWR